MTKKKRTYTPQQLAIIRRKLEEQEKQEEEYPHFRYYKKSRHPALVVSERTQDEYNYRKVSHSSSGLHRSEEVKPNPNPKDEEPMYIELKVRYDRKKYFGKRYPWKYKPKK